MKTEGNNTHIFFVPAEALYNPKEQGPWEDITVLFSVRPRKGSEFLQHGHNTCQLTCYTQDWLRQ